MARPSVFRCGDNAPNSPDFEGLISPHCRTIGLHHSGLPPNPLIGVAQFIRSLPFSLLFTPDPHSADLESVSDAVFSVSPNRNDDPVNSENKALYNRSIARTSLPAARRPSDNANSAHKGGTVSTFLFLFEDTADRTDGCEVGKDTPMPRRTLSNCIARKAEL